MKKYKAHLPELIYIVLLVSTGLMPNYGALDRIATQWFYLSVLNTFGLSVFLFDKKYKNLKLKELFQFKPLLFLVLFVIWGFVSYLYSINQTEVIVKTIRWVQLPISLFFLLCFIKNNFPYFIETISIIVSIILMVELYFSYSTFFDLTKFTSYNFSYANLIKGATGNKNINAASVLIKIPFVILLLYRSKPFILKIILGLIIALTIYLVLILSARAAILSLIFISLYLLIKYIVNLLSSNFKLNDFSFPLVLLCIVIPISFFSIKYSSNNSASIANRVTTINSEDTSTQQRLRYYKHSITQITQNPIIGVGLGNWKIKSVDYDKLDINGYIIPYHTHNDFLEIATELGVIGLIIYIMIFIYPLRAILINNSIKDPININTLILLSGIIYFIDANLNFPHARPVMQIPFLLILAFSFYQTLKTKKDV